MFDFDAIDHWGPSLVGHLAELVPAAAYAGLRSARPKFFEEYRDVLFRTTGVRPGEIIAATAEWLRSQPVIAYHGSRLTWREIEQIKSEGLKPLDTRSRVGRLQTILAQHPDWSGLSSRLCLLVDEFGINAAAHGHGLREGSVHAMISRAALLHAFKSYLIYGSEFDQMVVNTLFGQAGLRLMAEYGQAVVIKLQIPGPIAIEAANPFPGVNEKIPRPIGDILYGWARWVAGQTVSGADMHVDCGLRFAAPIPPNWIVGHEIFGCNAHG